MLDGSWREAARAWRELGCPLWEALALGSSPDLADGRRAMEIADRLGAPAVRDALLRSRHALGIPVPRGPRGPAARHPAGLTDRELEVLEQLPGQHQRGDRARLFLSEKTVGHHVSAILRKLDEPPGPARSPRPCAGRSSPRPREWPRAEPGVCPCRARPRRWTGCCGSWPAAARRRQECRCSWTSHDLHGPVTAEEVAKAHRPTSPSRTSSTRHYEPTGSARPGADLLPRRGAQRRGRGRRPPEGPRPPRRGHRRGHRRRVTRRPAVGRDIRTAGRRGRDMSEYLTRLMVRRAHRGPHGAGAAGPPGPRRRRPGSAVERDPQLGGEVPGRGREPARQSAATGPVRPSASRALT